MRRLCSVALVLSLSSVVPSRRQSISATLPNGRRITPAGAWIKVAPYPYTLALRPGSDELAEFASIGWPFSINVIDRAQDEYQVHRFPAGRKNDPEVQVHTGVVYSPDGKLLYDTERRYRRGTSCLDRHVEAGRRNRSSEWAYRWPRVSGEFRCIPGTQRRRPIALCARPGELASGCDRYAQPATVGLAADRQQSLFSGTLPGRRSPVHHQLEGSSSTRPSTA